MPKVLIRAKDEASADGFCEGPLWSGSCSLAAPGQPVACAGQEIVISDDQGVRLAVLGVEPDAQACPLVALSLWPESQTQRVGEEDTHEPLGYRDVLARVNLRDFGQMIRGEFMLVSTSLRLALQSWSAIGLLALPVAFFRLALLALVTVFFGAAIILITMARGAVRTSRARGRRKHP